MITSSNEPLAMRSTGDIATASAVPTLQHVAAAGGLPLDEWLGVAVQIADALANLHAAGLIHREINPANIAYDHDSRTVRLLNAGTSPGAQVTAHGAQAGANLLRYVSPEQTGRMNRTIDYRTDLYSLGATLYELLTRRPLFEASEPLEWLHCHIARDPIPPHRVDAAIPRVISDIVMKLLAKDADQRYRSARGVSADLARCREALRAGTRIEPFVLARDDLPTRLQLPQRLYGREQEIELLLAACARVSAGAAEILILAGYSGAGKSRLVRELYKPIVAHRGFFIGGKFDELHRNVPYSALASALRDLMRQLLAEPDERLSRWRAHLLAALGGQGQLMVALVPELELVIGPQPAVSELPPHRAEWRFQRAVLAFLRALCHAEHPLVLFLDDLQWADAATLQLLEQLAADMAVRHLYLIGAYRDNEVDARHPLRACLGNLRAAPMPVTELELKPLTRSALSELLADTLFVTRSDAAPLADLVLEKTGGNPFFTAAFLKHLVERGLLELDTANARWTWDLARIRDQQITANVIDLMQERVRHLSANTQRVLQVAACIGTRFDLEILLLVCDLSEPVIHDALRDAIGAGLVAPTGEIRPAPPSGASRTSTDALPAAGDLAFVHDRVQRATYTMLDDSARAETHLRIGRLLQARMSSSEQTGYLFEIADHLNLGAGRIDDPGERAALRRLNLEAGLRARGAAAYRTSYDYYGRALALLTADSWQQDHAVTLRIHANAAEAAYCIGAHDEAERLIRAALPHAGDIVQAATLHDVHLALLTAHSRHDEALQIGKQLLAALGVRYPQRARRWHVYLAGLRLQWRMRKFRQADIRALPMSTDPRAQATLRLSERVSAAALVAEPELFALMVMHGVGETLAHGVSEKSPTAFAALAGMLTLGGNIKAARALCATAAHLAARFPGSAAAARVATYDAIYVRPCYEPVQAQLEPLRCAYTRCLDGGDLEAAALAAAYYLVSAFASAMPLDELEREIAAWRESSKAVHHEDATDYMACLHQYVENLRGVAASPTQLAGEHYDATERLSVHLTNGAGGLRAIATILTMRANLCYSFGAPDAALQYADQLRPHLEALEGTFEGVAMHFHDGLIRLAVSRRADAASRRRLLRQVHRSQRVLDRWARQSPANFAAMHALLRAETFRATGAMLQAQAEYDRAIRLACESGHTHTEALANELAADMHLDAGRETVAGAYLDKAHAAYRRWNAHGKVRQLEQRFPHLAATTVSRAGDAGHDATALAANVDTAALMKALRAIAEEHVLSRMVRAIMVAAIEFAGAQRGMLLLRDGDGRLCVEAEGCVDQNEPGILQSIPVESSTELCHAAVNYVARLRRSLVVHDAQAACDELPGLETDAYVRSRGIRSLLCVPIVAATHQGPELIGMIYLENNRTTHCFTEQRCETLEIIGVAAAGRLEMTRKATIDGLTRLYNRDYFQSMLHQEVAGARRNARALSLILADIDDFKAFNDRHGHLVGDVVLQVAASAVQGACRDADTVARFGGEELAIVLPETDGPAALEVAERIRAAVEQTVLQHDGAALSVTMSLGVAVLDPRHASEQALIRAADTALYAAKQGGRNRVCMAR